MRFGLGAQRHERAGGKREFGRHVGYRTELAHHPVDEAARGAPGHQVGERRAIITRGLERSPVRAQEAAEAFAGAPASPDVEWLRRCVDDLVRLDA